MKTLGILGGMGPSASLDFYRTLIEYSGAQQNHEFPHLLLSNLPVPDFIDDRSREEEAVCMVKKEAKALERAGADELVIICNTMHLYLDRFQSAVDIPFVSMIDTVVKHVHSYSKSVGLLASPTTIASKLYQEPLHNRGVEVLVPTAKEQKMVTQSIYRTIANTQTTEDVKNIQSIADRMLKDGAEGIILGCTELPVLMRYVQGSIPFFASTDLLAHSLLSS